MVDEIVLSDFYDYIRILDGEGYPKNLLSLVNLEWNFLKFIKKQKQISFYPL